VDFIDQIRALAATAEKKRGYLQTEEATKHALVMPFIQILGYDVFDPTQVNPELTADVGLKKGEKVDYAILSDGEPVILFECKCCGCNLETEHASQLFRYFTVTPARFGVLTNGIVYRFYSDIEEPNKMDPKPFMDFNLQDFTEAQVEQLKRFTKATFVLDEVAESARELKYEREIKRIMAEELASPSLEFVRFFAVKIYSGLLRKNVLERFAETTRRALQQFISERISDRLKSALDKEREQIAVRKESAPPSATVAQPEIVTTDEEREAFFIVRAILREVVSPERVVMRDAKNYCAVLLDDSNRKPICRFYFDLEQKLLGFYGEGRQEDRVPMEDLTDLYRHAERLKGTVALYSTGRGTTAAPAGEAPQPG
jgi:predicted type IV restriction endonuclease